MATVRTDIEFRTNTQPLKKAGQEIKQAFSAAQLKSFHAATRDLERQLGTLTSTQMKLSKALTGVEKGTEAYKKLKDQIKGVREETDLVSRSMEQLDRIQSRAARQQQALGRQAQQGRLRNFGAGAAQGAGIAQYIPSGPGMGARIAGAGVVGGVRRAAGIAAAPFTTPGVAGLAQGLAGIPLVGGFAAGALNTAAGAYQAAVGHARARHQNVFLADRSRMGRKFRVRRRLTEAAPVTQARESVRAASIGMMTTEERERVARSVQLWEKNNPIPPPPPERGFGSKVGQDRIKARNEWHRRRAETRKLQQKAIIGELSDKVVAAKNEVSGKSASAKGGRRSRFRTATDTGLGAIGMGTKLGFEASQVEGMKGQFFGARGGEFNQRLFNESMAAQVRFGVSQQLAGGFARGNVAGGGGTGGASLTGFLRGAQAQGLQGTQVTEHLQTLVSLQQRAEKQGIKLDAAAFTKMSMQLKVSGLQGLQAGRVAGGMIGGMQDLSKRGATTPADMVLMRAAGFKPGGNMEDYFKAKAALESPTPGMLNKVMQSIAQGTSGAGGRFTQAGLAKSFLSRALKTDVSTQQAMNMLDAYRGGDPPSINELLQKQKALGGAGALMKEARKDVRGAGAGLAIGAAGLGVTQIGVGRGAAGWVQAFERSALNSAKVMNNFGGSLKQVAGWANSAMKALDALTSGDLGGILGKITGALGLGGDSEAKAAPPRGGR